MKQTRTAIHIDSLICDAEVMLTIDISSNARRVYNTKCPKCMGWIEFDFREAL